jgi:23S rRNA pseudouridine2605 synthase
MDGKSQPHKPGEQHQSGERIAKAIARAGLASRRTAEQWIAAGRVAINGTVIASPAHNVTATDSVTVDGTPLPERERTRLFLYHKPRGLMTTHADPQGRPTIFENLPKDLPRLISVGRLDLNTEGLLLLTNDGALARALELPTTGWLRRYRVRAHGSVMQPQLDTLRTGVTVSGIHYGAIDAELERVQGSNLWLSFAIREGKNREVRNVLGHLDLEVTRLIRVSFGPFQLGELAEGAVEEVRTRVLREQLGERLIAQTGADFSVPVAAPPAPRERDDGRAAAAGRDGPIAARPKTKDRKAASHAWRAHEEERPSKKLKRKFHGSRRDAETPRPQPAGPARAGLLTDRKGRRIFVERFGEPPPRQQPETDAPKRGKYRGRHGGRDDARAGGKRGRPDDKPGGKFSRPGRRHSPDRAAGARPSHPRGRR